MSEMLDDGAEMSAENVQETYTLKHNGKLYEVGYDELIALAQKGMDYDRIRNDRDECRKRLAENETLAVEDNSANALHGDLCAQADNEEAAAEEKMPINEEQAAIIDENGGKVWQDGFAQLLQVYPEVRNYRSFEALPEGFVEGLAEGLSPVAAWQMYLLDRQKLKLAMLERESSNRAAAAPDVRSSGRYDEDGFVKALFGK